MADILIVEDNRELAGLLRDFLKKEGYDVLIAGTGEAAIQLLNSQPVRLVVLDIMLPGMDGFAVCAKIREKQDIPIIIVSAKSAKDDKLNGLLLGADDYIEKPYDIDILRAKIHAVYRRNCMQEEKKENTKLISGNLVIDTDARIVTVDGEKITLNTKEFDLLFYLVENKGKALKKELIFDKIWGVDSFSEPSTLTVHIKWLRQKIEKDPKHPEKILTVWGIGYRYEEGAQV